MKKIFLATITIMLISGCVQEVKPWEKETLAKETMEISAGNPLKSAYEEHIYFSKEASRGGNGVSGGGCGCN